MKTIILIVGLTVSAMLQIVELVSKKFIIHDLRVHLHPERVEYSYTGEDQPKQLPLRVRPVAMTAEWLDDEVYSMYADSDWASLFPESNGWVKLGPKPDFYVLSMYHQMHCLDSMRYAYVVAKAGKIAFPGNGTEFDHHMNHCLTYLREAILCAADTTLERSYIYANSEGVLDHGADGMGMVHKCRDWNQVREYLESNYDEEDFVIRPSQ